MRALPDLTIEVKNRHVAAESLVVEVIIRGTHLGPWRGLPATGRRIEFPLCGVYAFDADDRLAAERIYYDRGVVLGQLGLFHEPLRGWGRVVTALSHPVTIARAYLRRFPRRTAESGPPHAARHARTVDSLTASGSSLHSAGNSDITVSPLV